jgi:glucokinase
MQSLQIEAIPRMFKQQVHQPTSNDGTALPVLDGSHVVGVDIGGTNLRLALADITGRIIARWSASTAGITDARVVVESIATGVRSLLRQQSIERSSLCAIAAGAPGVTNVETGVVIATSYLMGWRDVPLRELLEAAIGVPAAVDNDVNLAAIGESWTGAASNASDFTFLAIGTGVGAGIVLDHKLFRGRGWTAGEIGYMLVPGASESPAGSGMPGAFEAVVGGEGIKAQWRNVWSAAATSLPQDLLATRIFDYALEGEPLAQTILQQSARTLAYGIFNMALVLNCPLFVLGGSVGVHPALVDATRALLNQRSAQVSPVVTPSALGADAQLIGAVRFALDTANARAGIL